MLNNRPGFLSGTPPVVKNLIIINVLLYMITYVMGLKGVDLYHLLGLHYPKSELFQPFQYITHMFMHGGIFHIFFNMYTLWFFGRVLESVWGSKRFFVFYFISGIGAAAIHTFVNYIGYVSLEMKMTPEMFELVLREGSEVFREGKNFSDPLMGRLNELINTPTVGASGAIFGVILGFGMLFPNTQLMLIFPPIPIRAKYLAVVMLVVGILLDFKGNVAHFAHFGGMIFAFILIKYWNKTTKTFY